MQISPTGHLILMVNDDLDEQVEIDPPIWVLIERMDYELPQRQEKEKDEMAYCLMR
jgi:hypothetical protein